MASTVARLPDEHLAPLARAYRQALAEKQRQILVGFVALAGALVLAGFMAEVRPLEFIRHIDRFPTYIVRLFYLDSGASVFSDIGEWFWGWKHWLKLLLETMLIAYTGTLLGALAAFGLSFVISANLSRTAWLRISVKRFLEFCRTVPELVFALIFVVAFGLGPVPGVLAIAIHTMGALGKQFSEVVENIDMKPVEGITATGGGWWQVVRFAAVPQVLSNFVSYALLRFEINVRGAAVMGFVGAGGIGQDLIESIRKFYNSDVSAILILIILAVMLIDLATERLRHALIGRERP